MKATLARRAWAVPTAIGVLAVVVFALIVSLAAPVRPYWQLLVLSAVASAAPFLLRERATPARRPIPLPRPAGIAADTATDAPLALRASAVSLPKASAAPGENDDAYGIDADAGYVAVADGASSSFRAREWANALCAAFLARRPLDGAPSSSWITEATAAFRAATDAGSAAWWDAEAAERGAHAAFVGLALLRQEHGLRWRATAVGDSVLVHVRPAGQTPIVTAFPITHSAAFPQNPPLLSSVADTPPPVSSIEGPAAAGDIWLLMTDELARWALGRHEVGEPVWDLLAEGTRAELRAAIAQARADQHVADDDMTVVRCVVVDAD